MQINERLTSLVPAYALVGVTDIREMTWCLEHGLTPGAILTAAAKGIRSLKEMARLSEGYDHDAGTFVSAIDPFHLGGTSGIVHNADDPDTMRFRLYGEAEPGER